MPWVLYLSIVNVGQAWCSFGWESLLPETGFPAIFPGPAHTGVPVPVLWLLLWLLFRVPAVDGTLLPWSSSHLTEPPVWYGAVVIAVTVAVAMLSYWPIRNLIGQGQVMNFSFNRLHLVNTYGAFGSVTRDRYEVIVEGTDDLRLDSGARWREFEFKGKPGDPYRRPPRIAPYHLRSDWMLWFVSLSSRYGGRWLPALVTKLLDDDAEIRKLLRRDPFDGVPPTFVRARVFHYRFTTPTERRETGAWWVREPVGTVVRTCRLAPHGTAAPVPLPA